MGVVLRALLTLRKQTRRPHLLRHRLIVGRVDVRGGKDKESVTLVADGVTRVLAVEMLVMVVMVVVPELAAVVVVVIVVAAGVVKEAVAGFK